MPLVMTLVRAFNCRFSASCNYFNEASLNSSVARPAEVCFLVVSTLNYFHEDNLEIKITATMSNETHGKYL